MPFTSSSRVKEYLRIPAAVTQYDVLIGHLVDYANDRVLRELNLTAGMTEATYSDTLDVDANTRCLFLPRMPVRSVTAITDNGVALAASEFYVKRHGEVRLVNYDAFFTEGYQKVAITYRAGFTNAANGEGLPPPPLAHAASLIAVDGYNRGAMAGLRSEASGPYNTTTIADALPPEVERILAGYRIPML